MRESPEIEAEEMSLSDEEDSSDREDHWLPTLVFMCQEHDVTPKAIWVEGAAYQNVIPEFCQAFVDLGKWEYLFDATLNK